MNAVLGEGRYHLDEPIGYGGMATVYRAEDERLGRTVAVKVLADNLAADPSFRERFLREARLAARLAHPNVVRVFDVDEADDRPFIVMECVPGGTLADALRRDGPMAPARVAAVAEQAAAGLAAAHEAGLVHRDVKPGNLLLDDEGTVKIADFGIARAADSAHLTRTGTVLGTEAYLAPEQAAGLPVTAAADVYSLGVVLYEALTGTRLMTGETASADELARAGPVGAVIGRALAREPGDRPTAPAIAAALAGRGAIHSDPYRTDELPTTGVISPTAVLPAGAGGTSVVPAAGAAAAARDAWAQPRVRLATALAVFAIVGVAALVLAMRPDDKQVTTSDTATTVSPTTAAPTTLPAVAPPVTSCSPMSLSIPGFQYTGPNPNCAGASGGNSDGADGADGADGGYNGADGADGIDAGVNGADGASGRNSRGRGRGKAGDD